MGAEDDNTAEDKDKNDEELPLKDVVEPLDSDVLCGRGGAALRHPGNQTYRRLVNLNKGLYITCIKAEKLKISRSIVAAIREQKGRFLEKDNKTGTWYDIGDKKALEKTSQALREGQPKLRQQIAELGGSAVSAAAMMEAQQYSAASATPPSVYSGNDANNLAGSATAFATSGNYGGLEYSSLDAQTAAVLQQQTLNYGTPNGTMSSNMQPGNMNNMQPVQPDQILQRLSLSDIQEVEASRAARMRPSIIQRGSVSQELGFDQLSQLSLASEFSNFGMGADSMKSIDANGQTFTAEDIQRYNESIAATQLDSTPPKVPGSVDRRKFFAKMKVNRPSGSGRMTASGRMSNSSARDSNPSMTNSSSKVGSIPSLSDGMPDIHLVESNMTLGSNISSVGDPTERSSAVDVMESRRSLMSGLSRMSEGSEVNSIISDLSRKIGNVSTRSMAMSEISIMEDTDSVDTPDVPASGPQPMASYTMDYE